MISVLLRADIGDVFILCAAFVEINAACVALVAIALRRATAEVTEGQVFPFERKFKAQTRQIHRVFAHGSVQPDGNLSRRADITLHCEAKIRRAGNARKRSFKAYAAFQNSAGIDLLELPVQAFSPPRVVATPIDFYLLVVIRRRAPRGQAHRRGQQFFAAKL